MKTFTPSRLTRRYIYLLSVSAGLLSLVFFHASITFRINTTNISLPWAIVFPVIISLSYGPRFGILSGLAGGSWFPVLLWPSDGLANITTALLFTLYYAAVGTLSKRKTRQRGSRFYRKLFLFLLWFIPLMSLYFLLIFPFVLSFNPLLLQGDTVSHIDVSLRSSFILKDGFILILLTVLAETLLRLPFLRRFLRLRPASFMHMNTRLFTVSVGGGLVFWLIYFILSFLLINGIMPAIRPFMHLSLLMVITAGSIVARALIAFSERMYITNVALQGSRRQLQAALNEKQLLIKELYHRTKNNLQTINSLISLKTSESSSEEVHNLFADIENQISAMSLVHTKLYQSHNLSSIDLQSYIQELYDLISQGYAAANRVDCKVHAPDVSMPLNMAIFCGLILNELITNSFKHAFRDNRRGNIQILVRFGSNSSYILRYCDDGVGTAEPERLSNSSGIGMSTVSSLVEDQLKGSLRIESVNGLAYTITWPNN